MAWNKYYIFVSNQEKTDFETILPQLGLGGYKTEGEEVNLYDTNKPKTLFATNFNGVLMLVHPELVFEFYTQEPTETERKFINCFPNSEIAILYHNETVSGFGFSIIQNGKRIRLKDGTDGEIYNDFGVTLKEEEELLIQQLFEDDELEEIQEDMDEEEFQNFIAFEKSIHVPIELTKRYLGQRIDEIDGENMKFIKFSK
jgi:hypothetical protein